MNKITSGIYDSLAPYYQQYSKKRSVYLNVINKLVLENIPKGAKSLLDVGAGDGTRGVSIAQKSKIKTIVLSDISYEMIKMCKRLDVSEVWHTKAEDLPQKNIRFDVILCLWNVLGHIDNETKRIQALKKMFLLLSPKGKIFLDVNNRYNAEAYGWFRVIKNLLIDRLFWNNNKGDVQFFWTVRHKKISAKGHFFSPGEIADLIFKAKLKIRRRYIVDYNNGEITPSIFNGQLFYILTK